MEKLQITDKRNPILTIAVRTKRTIDVLLKVAIAEADINALLTQIQSAVQRNQAEQEEVLLLQHFMNVHILEVAVLLQKAG